MSWKGWAIVAAVLAVVQVPLVHQLFWAPQTKGHVPFEDHFQRAEVGPMYRPDFYRAFEPVIENGWLHVPPVKNNPLWLRVPLPRDVSISFKVKTEQATGDIKFEAFGDGRDHESGYVFIFGGWHNTISVLARHDEHGLDRKERRDVRVVPGRIYHMRVTRKNGAIKWYIDGSLFLERNDKHPLVGKGHDRFAFSAWQTPLEFDNLEIEKLAAGDPG